jgi:hypothetical protein
MTGRAALKRMIAVVGLVLMIPLGLQLVQGTLTPSDAAFRGVALFVAVVVGRGLANLAPGAVTVLKPASEPQAVSGPQEG